MRVHSIGRPADTCSEHPAVELVPANARSSWRARDDGRRECPEPSHRSLAAGWDQHRCAWCGGPMLLRAAWRAVYCSGRCRVAAHRAGRNVRRRRPSLQPGSVPAGMSPADEASKGGPA